jgi:outer membrane protein OmpA-like peptidoglycan-associated protein/tetratricopeptide (TPR) repeat protein
MKKFLIILSVLVAFNSSFAQKKKADKYYAKAFYAKAIPLYAKASKKTGDEQQESLIRLGDCYRILNEYKKAEDSYKQAFAMNGKISPEAKYNYGYVLKTNNNYTEALNQFNSYLADKPSESKAKNAIRSCQQIKYWQTKAVEYEIKNVEGLNTSRSEFCPAVLNNKLVYVGEKQSDFFEYTVDEMNGDPYMNVYVSKINIEKASGSKSLSGKINGEYHDGPVSFSADGKTLLFTRVDYKAKKDENFVNRAKIYFAAGHDSKWHDIKPFQYNSDDYSVAHPSLSADGNYLLFTSDMPGGQGGKDIWICKKSGDGWEKPVNLGVDINTSGDEMFPNLRKDGVLFFASNGLAGFGGLDIFSAREKEGKWILSRNESLHLNSPADDFSICFLNDSTGYFSSNREGGKGKDDIYWFKYTNKYINVTGTVLLTENTNDPAMNLKVRLYGPDGKLLDSTRTDKKGFFKFENLDADKKYMAEVDSDDPQLQGKARYYMANSNGVVSRVTNNVDNKKFAFRNLPMDPNGLPDLFTDDDLTMAGNLLFGENPSKPVKNTKIKVTNQYGDVVETTTTNEFGAFAFRNLPPDQNYMISIEETDLEIPANTKVILTNKSGKEIKSFYTQMNGKFKFNMLSSEKNMLKDLDVEDADLIMQLYGYVYDQDKKPFNNAKLFLYTEDKQLNQTITTDEKGRFAFKNLKANMEYLFDVDDSDPRINALKKLYIADTKGRIYKELVRTLKGKFEFKVLAADKVAMGDFSVDDPWLQVLELKNKADKVRKDSLTIIENIYYAFGDYKFDKAGQNVLDKVVSVMQSNPNLMVELSSHTDSKSSDQFNNALSQKRAKTAVDYMISKGVSKSRLKAIGYGETRLLNKCKDGVECTDEEHAKNRRTEFKIVEKPKV